MVEVVKELKQMHPGFLADVECNHEQMDLVECNRALWKKLDSSWFINHFDSQAALFAQNAKLLKETLPRVQPS